MHATGRLYATNGVPATDLDLRRSDIGQKMTSATQFGVGRRAQLAEPQDWNYNIAIHMEVHEDG